jgi:hypothetical protein
MKNPFKNSFKILSTLIILLGLAGVVCAQAPSVKWVSPDLKSYPKSPNGFSMVDKADVMVTLQVEGVSKVLFNGREISVPKDGIIIKKLTWAEGVAMASVKAKNSSGNVDITEKFITKAAYTAYMKEKARKEEEAKPRIAKEKDPEAVNPVFEGKMPAQSAPALQPPPAPAPAPVAPPPTPVHPATSPAATSPVPASEAVPSVNLEKQKKTEEKSRTIDVKNVFTDPIPLPSFSELLSPEIPTLPVDILESPLKKKLQPYHSRKS